MAMSGFRSSTRRELRASGDAFGGPRRASSFSDASSRYFSDPTSAIDSSSFHDGFPQRDSDQDSFCPDDSGASNIRHLTSDSESESSSIIDRFRQTSTRNESSTTIPRFQQSTASARGRQRTIEPYQPRSLSREPVRRSYTRSESEEPGLRRSGRSESREPGSRRGESREPAGRHRRSESQEPGLNRFSFSKDEFPEPHRGRSSQRAEIVFTSNRPRRSESQEPRGRSNSKEPLHRRRSESQGPGMRFGALKQLDDAQLLVQHPASDVQDEERTITAVHAQLKADDPPAGEFVSGNLYGAMRAEVRKAVADLKTEIEKSLEKDMLTLVKSKGEITETEIRKHYAEKLEQSESRTKELLSELAREEETRHELSKLITSPAKSQPSNKPEPKVTKPEQRLKARSDVEKRRSISKALDEEAQKYFEEFASISTSESEEPVRRRSRTSPSRNPVRKKSPPKLQGQASAPQGVPRWRSGSVAVNTDGVVTPWLDWETDSADDTLAEINWESIAALTLVPADDPFRECESPQVQRLRFRERLEAGRLHLCLKSEF